MNRGSALLVASLVLVTVSAVHAQQPSSNPNLEVRSGSVKEIIKKGKARTLVVSTGGEDLSFPITPKIQLEIHFSGGSGAALQPGAYIEGTGTQSHRNLILDSAKIFLISSSVKTPPAQVKAPAEKAVGQSVNLKVLTGQIMARQASTNFEGYQELGFRAAGDFPSVLFKDDLKVDVVSTQVDDAEVGQKIVLELLPGRGNKSTLVRATIEGGTYTPKDAAEEKKDK